jgi:hypothetical protein
MNVATRSERFTNKPKMYMEGNRTEAILVKDLEEMSFEQKSFLDDNFLSERDELPLGSRVAICPEINPEKDNNKYAIDYLINFYVEENGSWKKYKTSLGDLKTRNEPLYKADSKYDIARRDNKDIVKFPWYETTGLDFGNAHYGREYAKYLPIAEKGDDVYILYAVNYEGTRTLKNVKYTFPVPNQNLWITSTLRVKEAHEAGMLLVTDYSGYRFQLPFPLILPSGKRLFQKVISNYIIDLK